MNDRVYVMGEKSVLPGHPPATDWHKIGRSDPDAGLNKGNDDWYERTRALNQGNPRGLEPKHQINVEGSARRLEDAIHKECRKRGIPNLKDITGLVGHAEWWNLTEQEAINVSEEVYEKEYGTLGTFFTDPDGNPASIRN